MNPLPFFLVCIARWMNHHQQVVIAYLVGSKDSNEPVLFGEGALRHCLDHYLSHYHSEWNHRGQGNVILFPAPADRIGNFDRLALNEVMERRRVGDDSASLATQDFVQRCPVRLQITEGVVQGHVAFGQKAFGLPVIQTEHFAHLTLGKTASAVFLDGRVFGEPL